MSAIENTAPNYGTEVLVQLHADDLATVSQLNDKPFQTAVSSNRFTVTDLSDLHHKHGFLVHELIRRGSLLLPRPPPPPPRSSELELRCQKMRKLQESAEYRRMTKNVDPAGVFRQTGQPVDNPSEESLGVQMKKVNQQLTVVLNTVLTTGGAFVFGYVGIPLMVPSMPLEVATRAALGCFFGTIVFFADMYFLISNTV